MAPHNLICPRLQLFLCKAPLAFYVNTPRNIFYTAYKGRHSSFCTVGVHSSFCMAMNKVDRRGHRRLDRCDRKAGHDCTWTYMVSEGGPVDIYCSYLLKNKEKS